MDEGVYEVIGVKDSDHREGQEFVRIEGGMRGFHADTGEYDVGDMVKVEAYEDYRGQESYRVVGAVDD